MRVDSDETPKTEPPHRDYVESLGPKSPEKKKKGINPARIHGEDGHSPYDVDVITPK